MTEPRQASPPEPPVLNALFQPWMEQLLGGPLPAEPLATCASCPMLPTSDTPRLAHERVFNPRTRCCTFYPNTPNFLVGLALADPDPALAPGRAVLEDQVASAPNCNPLGIRIPDAYARRRDQEGEAAFGMDEALRCPYLGDDARCGLWRYRISVCQTWFCKHQHGVRAFRFWHLLKELMGMVEQKLALWCAAQVGLGDVAYVSLYPSIERWFSPSIKLEMDRPHVPQVVAGPLHWGPWAQRRREYFLRCGELVRDLSWADVEAVIGVDFRVYPLAVKRAYALLTRPVLPRRVRPGRLTVAGLGSHVVGIEPYSRYHPVDLPLSLLPVLPHFQGRPVDEALAVIRAESGLELTPDDVQTLLDFEILVED